MIVDVKEFLLGRKIRIQLYDRADLPETVVGTIEGFVNQASPILLNQYGGIDYPTILHVKLENPLGVREESSGIQRSVQFIELIVWEREDLKMLVEKGKTRPLACMLYILAQNLQYTNPSLTLDKMHGVSKEADATLIDVSS